MISAIKEVGNLSAITLSKTGENHVKMGISNQDSISFESNEENFVLVVSDGVGSCKYSDIGSKAAVSICVDLFKEILDGKLNLDNTKIVSELIQRWKGLFGENCEEYCATLKLAIKIGNKLSLFSLGDGFVAVTSDGMRVISPEENSSFTNETKCLDARITASDIWTNNFTIDTNTSYVLMACTDGVSNGIKTGDELAFAEEIEKNVGREVLMVELQEFLEVISEYCFDDKTLGVVKYEQQNR